MDVGLVGEDLVVDVVADHLEERASSMARVGIEDTPEVDVLVVTGTAGDERFLNGNDHARSAGATFVSIEFDGIGGRHLPGVEGGIGIFDASGACFRCLRTRVTAAMDGEREPMAPDRSLQRVVGALAGHKLLERATMNGDTLGATVIELPFVTRSLLPVPGCETCDPDWRQRWGVDPMDDRTQRGLEEAVAAAELAFDQRLGPVVTVGEVDSIPLPYYFAELAETNGFSDVSAAAQAAGVSEDLDEAFMKAVGECLERYAAGVYRERTLTDAKPDALSGAVPPGRFVAPHEPEEDSSRLWVPGEELGSGTNRWLPAETVLFPPPERRIRPQITTGLALGNSRVGAALNGLGEVLERDAAMLAWYSDYEPLGLAVDDPEFGRLCRFAAISSLSVSVVLLTQDVDLPVIGAAIHREEAWPRFAVGSAAGLDPIEAANSAVREALQNWMELDRMGPEVARRDAERLAEYATDPGPAGAFFEGVGSVSIDRVDPGGPYTGGDALEQVVSLTTRAEMQPFASWLTTRDLRVLGFEAVRVVIPSAQPLFTGDAYFGDRAKRVPTEMGYTPHLARDAHPFP